MYRAVGSPRFTSLMEDSPARVGSYHSHRWQVRLKLLDLLGGPTVIEREYTIEPCEGCKRPKGTLCIRTHAQRDPHSKLPAIRDPR